MGALILSPCLPPERLAPGRAPGPVPGVLTGANLSGGKHGDSANAPMFTFYEGPATVNVYSHYNPTGEEPVSLTGKWPVADTAQVALS